MVELTQEQQQFLNECEEAFCDRYTEKDEDFMKIKLAEIKPPPIVDPWHNAPQGSNNWSRHGRDRRNQNWQRHDRGRDWDRGRDRDRDRDHRYGGKYRSYRPY